VCYTVINTKGKEPKMTGIEALHIRRDELSEDIRLLSNRIVARAIDWNHAEVLEIAQQLAEAVEEKNLIVKELIRLNRAAA